MTAPRPSVSKPPPELADPAFQRRLVALARRLTTPNSAEDLLSQALVRVCDPERSRWDPAACTLYAHVARLMRDIVIKRHSSARARHEVVDSDIAHVDAVIDVGDPADELAADSEEMVRYRRCGAALRATLGARNDLEAIAVFDLRCRGVETRIALAAELGWTDLAVRRTMQRISELAVKIKIEDDLAEDNRLRALREATLRTQGARDHDA